MLPDVSLAGMVSYQPEVCEVSGGCVGAEGHGRECELVSV